MGIRTEIKVQKGVELHDLNFSDGILPLMNLKQKDGVKKGSISWYEPDPFSVGRTYQRGFGVEAGADAESGTGGYAYLGCDLYLVDTKRTKAIIVNHPPLRIKLTATKG